MKPRHPTLKVDSSPAEPPGKPKYIAWRGSEITPVIKEVVKSASDSKYTHDEFYQILNDEYRNYNLINSIESQRSDYPTSSDGHHSFVSFGSNGINFGVMS